MSNKNKLSKIDEHSVHEPSVGYVAQDKTIRFYTGFEEQQASEDAYLMSITPIERLRQAVEIIKQVYREELLNNIESKRINFLKAE